jgi:ribosomal protein S18 acetylase RimI-like enzyme
MSSGAIAKYSKRVEALVGIAKVVVACDPKNEDVIYGFIVYEEGEYLGRDAPTLHMVWVRKKFRQLGIGSQLLCNAFAGNMPLIYTHHTKDITRAKLKEKWNLVEYDPYYVEGALYVQARKFDAKALYWSELTNSVHSFEGVCRHATRRDVEPE